MRAAAAEVWEVSDCRLDEGWISKDALRPSDWHSAQKQRRFSVVTHCAPTDDFTHSGFAGIPLHRSPELIALAEQVAARTVEAGFSDEWAETLAEDFARFND